MNFWRFFKRDTSDNLSIDLAAQALEQIIMRHKFGGIESSSTTPGSHTYAGEGYFYYAWFGIVAGANSHNASLYVEIDDVKLYPYSTFANYSDQGFENNDIGPMKLLKYGVDGACKFIFFFNPPLYFSSKLKMGMGATAGLSVGLSYFYTKI